ncbi:MAG: radical SAM protein [Methanomicrobiaceae archaeon]|nr:radical SAM protein [Methanomicrobiaceae archaeon]MDD5418553.1 radical SAM protein [Methanomicrobiaceae archaeon]
MYSVQIESNTDCPQGCRYCYAATGDGGKELPRSAVLRVIESAVRMGVRAVDWLGGDPLIRRDWYEIMKYAAGRGLTNNIWSSGMPLQIRAHAKRAVEVSEGGFIAVHLDSLNPEIYGRMHTGDPERQIEAVLKGVDNLLHLGKRPEHLINCVTFTKPLAGEDLEETIRYFAEEKGMRTCLTQLCMVGLAEKHPEWVPGAGEIKEACETRDRYSLKDSGLSISTMDVTKFYCGGTICVTVDGDVTPCSVIRKGFGNIHASLLEEIVDRHRDELLFMPLRNGNAPGYCSRCENNPICWGCRATAYYAHGDLLGEDPTCWRNSRHDR